MNLQNIFNGAWGTFGQLYEALGVRREWIAGLWSVLFSSTIR